MKTNTYMKWIVLAGVMTACLSACGSSRVSPQVGFGVPLQRGQAPAMNFQWYQQQ